MRLLYGLTLLALFSPLPVSVSADAGAGAAAGGGKSAAELSTEGSRLLAAGKYSDAARAFGQAIGEQSRSWRRRS